MPWHASEKPDNRCPVDKPWAVILDSTGEAIQCHESKAKAESAVRALYTNVEEGGKSMMHKMMVDAQYKALPVEEYSPGTFSAVVAAYGNVDRMGDRVVEGAFDASLTEWQKKGEPIPIILAHEWNNPFAHVGYVDPYKMKSVPGVGLVVEEGHLDIEDNPTAAQVYRLMERKQLSQFSFGYTIPKGGMTKALDGAFDLKQLNLVEVGPCLRGVNDKTQLLSIKAQLDAEERELTVEERMSRLEARFDAVVDVEGKADDGPPQAAYDPQKAKASMVITANAFIDKVNEAEAADAMREVVSAIGKVPAATPKPEFAGTKSEEAPEAESDIETPAEEPIIVVEPDAPEVEAEVEEEEASVEPEDPELKGLSPEEIERKLQLMTLEAGLQSFENDMEQKGLLKKGDNLQDRMKNLEDELS